MNEKKRAALNFRTIAYEAKGWLMVSPAFVVKLVFVVYPLVKAFRMAFYTKYNYLLETGSGFGLKAFSYVLGDPTFIAALKNTFLLFCVGLPIAMVLSLGIALLAIFFISDPFQGLIISQMLLSIQLPFTIFLQVGLTSSPRVMGEYANSPRSRILLYSIAAIVSALNLYLFYSAIAG